jgi:hypothetical protein
LTYGASLSVAVETGETAAMPYDGVYAIATPVRGPLLELEDEALSRLAALVEYATAAEVAR